MDESIPSGAEAGQLEKKLDSSVPAAGPENPNAEYFEKPEFYIGQMIISGYVSENLAYKKKESINPGAVAKLNK